MIANNSLFLLDSITRLKYTYDKARSHETLLYSLSDYYCVAVKEEEMHITTDGFDDILLKNIDKQLLRLPIYHRIQTLQKWLHSNLLNYRPKPAKSSWDVMISDSIKTQPHNKDVAAFLTEVENLPPALKRNLGGLHEITGIANLAHSIEMDEVMAVSDASTGTRHRAAHAYIVESRCERYRII